MACRLLALLLLLAAPAQAVTTIAFLGDSLTATAVSRAPIPWSHLIEVSLNAQYPGQYACANYGTGGHTAAQNLTTWTNNIRGRGVDVLVVLTGINGIVLDQTGATVWTSINQIVDEAKADGLTVVLITTTPFGNYIGWTAGRQTELDSLLTSIRAEGGVTLLDLYPSWEELVDGGGGSDDLRADYDVGDGSHFNTAAQAALAAAVETALGL